MNDEYTRDIEPTNFREEYGLTRWDVVRHIYLDWHTKPTIIFKDGGIQNGTCPKCKSFIVKRTIGWGRDK